MGLERQIWSLVLCTPLATPLGQHRDFLELCSSLKHQVFFATICEDISSTRDFVLLQGWLEAVPSAALCACHNPFALNAATSRHYGMIAFSL